MSSSPLTLALPGSVPQAQIALATKSAASAVFPGSMRSLFPEEVCCWRRLTDGPMGMTNLSCQALHTQITMWLRYVSQFVAERPQTAQFNFQHSFT